MEQGVPSEKWPNIEKENLFPCWKCGKWFPWFFFRESYEQLTDCIEHEHFKCCDDCLKSLTTVHVLPEELDQKKMEFKGEKDAYQKTQSICDGGNGKGEEIGARVVCTWHCSVKVKTMRNGKTASQTRSLRT